MEWIDFEGQRVATALQRHGAADDLLSAGLGIAGLQARILPPTAALDRTARRRRAVHANWQGIAYLAEPGAHTREALARPIPGQELHALLRPAGAAGHRVMLQVPEGFDPCRPRLLVTAASGSRGIYGAIALASAWGLPRGWAVVHTDKGCGTDWYDVDSGSSPDLLGAMSDDPQRQLFRPDAVGLPSHSVLTPHAHSMAHPEAHWGRYLRQAMRFGWAALDALFPAQRPSRSRHRRCLALGLSNGGAAVLRAIERPGGFDGALALAPNVLPARGGRGFLDYAAEAALWLPLALQSAKSGRAVDTLRPFAPLPPERLLEASERALRRLFGRTPSPREAWRHLRRRGWAAQTLRSATLSTLFDFWHAAGHTYSAALSRAAAGSPPLGAHFAALDGDGQPRATEAAERALWWCDGAGIVPGVGVGIADQQAREDTLCRLYRLQRGGQRDSCLAAGVAATRCRPPGGDLPLIILHGQRDGLIPPAFSSLPYARMALAAGARVQLLCPENAPHFDAFLALPGYRQDLQPLLPQAFGALDRLAGALG